MGAYLAGTHPFIRCGRRTFRHVPSSPRCKFCSVPFAGVGRVLFDRLGFQPWDKNPNLCRRCITSLNRQEVSGAEIEASFLLPTSVARATSPGPSARWSSPA
jgi:adenylate cyclase